MLKITSMHKLQRPAPPRSRLRSDMRHGYYITIKYDVRRTTSHLAHNASS